MSAIYRTPILSERGKFLALDLGGTNFRVLLIHLKGENDVEMQSQIYAVPQTIMLGRGEELFDHIANCLANFMAEHNVFEERLSLGFTFSFPLLQLGLTKGLLVKWTKGFNCTEVAGEDVVKLLKDAIKRRGVRQMGTIFHLMSERSLPVGYSNRYLCNSQRYHGYIDVVCLEES